MEIQFRPHHFLCTLCFQGRGYSPAFITNFQMIVDMLNAPNGDATRITVVPHTDSICAPCPNRLDKKCEMEEKVTALDRAHSDALKFQANESMTWGEAKKRIADNLSLEKFHEMCTTCEWKKYGLCEKVLSEFLQN